MHKEDATLNLYRALMEEVRIRLGAVSHFAGPASGLPAPLAREACYLQFRMICELIALGCLAAHGDIEATQTGKLKKAYAADWIIKQLEDLHPQFYPQPFVQSPPKSATAHWGLQGGVIDNYLTKEMFVDLYAKCGDHLHKGSMKKLLTPKMPVETKFADISDWNGKIVRLLNHHWIAKRDRPAGYLVLMRNPDDDRVQVAFAEGMPDDQPEGSPSPHPEVAG